MPAAVAVVASFATASAGIAAVGAATTALGTIAGYAMVAGAVLTGVGAVTGKKDLMKLGAVLSLAGGVGSAATTLAAGAGAGAGTAGLSGMDLAADAAAGSANSVSGAGAALGGTAASTAPALGEITLGSAWKELGQTAIPGGDMVAAVDPMSAGLGAASQAGSAAQPSLMDLAAQRMTQSPADAMNSLSNTIASGSVDAVAEGAKGLTSKDMTSIWDKIKNVGQFVKDNKELVQLGGGALNSMYGPEAEMVDLQKSLMDRRRRNLNAPAIIQPLKPIGT